MSQSSPKRLIVPVNEQGKVGKTTFFTSLLQSFKDHPSKPAWCAFDPDPKQPALRDFHPEARPLDLSDTKNLDTLVKSFAVSDVIVADGRGGHYETAFASWMREVRLLSIAQRIGARVTYVFLTDGSVKNVEQARGVIEGVISKDEDVDLLVVINPISLPVTAQPHFWLNSPTREAFLKRGAIEFAMPRLHHDLMQYVEKFFHTPAVLAQQGINMGLDFCDHARFVDFAELFNQQVAAAARVLLPSPKGASEVPSNEGANADSIDRSAKKSRAVRV